MVCIINELMEKKDSQQFERIPEAVDGVRGVHYIVEFKIFAIHVTVCLIVSAVLINDIGVTFAKLLSNCIPLAEA